MKQYLKMLTNTKLFSGIVENEIGAMVNCLDGTKATYARGEYIFRRGEYITRFGLLLKGSIHIQKEDYWGNLSILSEVSEGEVFGEAFACGGNTESMYHVVAVKECEILFLDVSRVITTCSSACKFHRRLIQNLLTVMASRNRTLTQKLEHMAKRTTREKLLSYLSEQSLKAGSSTFDISFNRQQLADFLSVDRSAMSNELCKMRDEGILEFEKNHFVLK